MATLCADTCSWRWAFWIPWTPIESRLDALMKLRSRPPSRFPATG